MLSHTTEESNLPDGIQASSSAEESPTVVKDSQLEDEVGEEFDVDDGRKGYLNERVGGGFFLNTFIRFSGLLLASLRSLLDKVKSISSSWVRTYLTIAIILPLLSTAQLSFKLVTLVLDASQFISSSLVPVEGGAQVEDTADEIINLTMLRQQINERNKDLSLIVQKIVKESKIPFLSAYVRGRTLEAAASVTVVKRTPPPPPPPPPPMMIFNVPTPRISFALTPPSNENTPTTNNESSSLPPSSSLTSPPRRNFTIAEIRTRGKVAGVNGRGNATSVSDETSSTRSVSPSFQEAPLTNSGNTIVTSSNLVLQKRIPKSVILKAGTGVAGAPPTVGPLDLRHLLEAGKNLKKTNVQRSVSGTPQPKSKIERILDSNLNLDTSKHGGMAGGSNLDQEDFIFRALFQKFNNNVRTPEEEEEDEGGEDLRSLTNGQPPNEWD